MSNQNKHSKLIGYAIILVVLFFGLIRMFVDTTGKFFTFEFIGFIFLLLLSFIAFFGYHKEWGERLLFFVFLFYIINLLLVWHRTGTVYLILLILSLIGFVLAIPKKKIRPAVEYIEMRLGKKDQESEPSLV